MLVLVILFVTFSAIQLSWNYNYRAGKLLLSLIIPTQEVLGCV